MPRVNFFFKVFKSLVSSSKLKRVQRRKNKVESVCNARHKSVWGNGGVTALFV